jgi:hypothetical protein
MKVFRDLIALSPKGWGFKTQKALSINKFVIGD